MNEGGNIVRTTLGTSHKEAETIGIRATKENLEFTSPDEVRFNGKEGGKKFGDFKKTDELELRVVKIDGPFDSENKKVENITKGQQYSYRVLKFNRIPKKEELISLKWAIQFDDKTITNMPNVFGSKVAYFTIPKSANLNLFSVYAFVFKIDNTIKINVEVNNKYYRFNPLSYAKGKYSSLLNTLYTKRETWGADEPIINNERSFEPYCLVGSKMSLDNQDRLAIPQLNEIYFGIAIHHSGNNGIDTMTKVQDEHVNGKNEFADVGYHFGIDLSGKVYEGRFIGVKGSHLTRYNTGIIGIVFLADFDHQWWDGDDDMTNAALYSVITLIKALQEQFPNINVLGGHKEWKNNVGERSCPGEYGLNFVKALRTRLEMKSPNEAGHG